jgi:hypothetical protein
MNLIGQTSEAERLVGILAGLGLVGYFFVSGVMSWLRRPLPPDPWDEQVSADLAEGNGAPICHRCLAAHDAMADFCPDCGASVGKYTNWLPYPYVFALGHTLRIGTSGTFRRSPLTIAGFIILSIAEYAVFAPFYWLRFFLNLPNGRSSSSPENEIPDDKS